MKQISKKISNRNLVLILIWLILLFSSILSLEILSSYLNSNPSQRIISSIWAGYVVSSNFDKSQINITSISASWIVPTAFPTTTDTYSSAWIGIGGFQPDKTLIQTGTEHDYFNGKDFYAAWYEILPDQAIRIEEIEVSPGDLIKASIELTDQQKNEWKIEIKDVTKNQEFSINLNYNSSMISADWILERPTVQNQISSLANFGSVNFTNCQATIDQISKPLGEYPHTIITMTNDLSVRLAAVSSLNEKKTDFTVQFNKSS